MSYNIFTMRSLFSWALKAQAPRTGLQPVQLSRFFSEMSKGAAAAEEDTAEISPTDKRPFEKHSAFEKSVNEVRLLGRIGKDPTIHEGKRKPYVTFPLATSSANWDSETGQYNEVTEWHTIVNYNPQKIENISRFLKKGDRVYVSGKLVYRLGSGTEKAPKIILTDFISIYS